MHSRSALVNGLLRVYNCSSNRCVVISWAFVVAFIWFIYAVDIIRKKRKKAKEKKKGKQSKTHTKWLSENERNDEKKKIHWKITMRLHFRNDINVWCLWIVVDWYWTIKLLKLLPNELLCCGVSRQLSVFYITHLLMAFNLPTAYHLSLQSINFFFYFKWIMMFMAVWIGFFSCGCCCTDPALDYAYAYHLSHTALILFILFKIIIIIILQGPLAKLSRQTWMRMVCIERICVRNRVMRIILLPFFRLMNPFLFCLLIFLF